MTSTDVLVIGAGPTGLTMANVLARSGVRFRILDQKARVVQETRAIAIHAKTLEILDKLGVTEEMIPEGEKLLAIQVLSGGKRASGLEFLRDTGAKSTPYPFGLIYGQDQTERVLLKHLVKQQGRVEWNKQLVSLEQTSESVVAHVRAADGSEEVIEAKWVVGADGAHSPVRHALSLGFEGETYEQTLFVADVEINWGLHPRRASIELIREGFFLFIPMPGAGRFRVYGTLPPDLMSRDTLTIEEVQHVLDTESKEHVTLQKMNWNSMYRTHHRVTEHFHVGRVFLVGDAAHIHSPAGAQGMNTGIGDAFNLGWKLALVAKGVAHETLLNSYEAERLPFAHAILRGSNVGFHIQATTNPFLRWLRITLLPPIFPLVAWIPSARRGFFWIVSQLWTKYRTSPAVSDSESVKKGPRAGDRAPYGFFQAGPDANESNFALLKDPDHHLFVFASNSPSMNMERLTGQLHSLLDNYMLPVHVHPVSAANVQLHTLYEVQRPTLILVRPDGHIAYRGWAEDLDSLRLYLSGLFWKREQSQQTQMDLALDTLVPGSF